MLNIVQCEEPTINWFLNKIKQENLGDIVSLEEVNIDKKKAVIVGKIVNIKSTLFEQKRVALYIREVLPNCEYGQKFNAIVGGDLAIELINFNPEVGDRLAFLEPDVKYNPVFVDKGEVKQSKYLLQIGWSKNELMWCAKKKFTIIPKEASREKLNNAKNCSILKSSLTGLENPKPTTSKTHPMSTSVKQLKNNSYGSGILNRPKSTSDDDDCVEIPSTKAGSVSMKNSANSSNFNVQQKPRIELPQKSLSPPKTMTQRVNPRYMYKKLAQVTAEALEGNLGRVNVFCAVYQIKKVLTMTQTGKYTIICKITDESTPGLFDFDLHFFTSEDTILKQIEKGDILRIHRMKLEESPRQGMVDGRIFFNNDILLFKKDCEEITPITTAKTYTFTDEDKKRVMFLKKWYEEQLIEHEMANGVDVLGEISDKGTYRLMCKVVDQPKVEINIRKIKVTDGSEIKCLSPSMPLKRYRKKNTPPLHIVTIIEIDNNLVEYHKIQAGDFVFFPEVEAVKSQYLTLRITTDSSPSVLHQNMKNVVQIIRKLKEFEVEHHGPDNVLQLYNAEERHTKETSESHLTSHSNPLVQKNVVSPNKGSEQNSDQLNINNGKRNISPNTRSEKNIVLPNRRSVQSNVSSDTLNEQNTVLPNTTCVKNSALSNSNCQENTVLANIKIGHNTISPNTNIQQNNISHNQSSEQLPVSPNTKRGKNNIPPNSNSVPNIVSLNKKSKEKIYPQSPISVENSASPNRDIEQLSLTPDASSEQIVVCNNRKIESSRKSITEDLKSSNFLCNTSCKRPENRAITKAHLGKKEAEIIPESKGGKARKSLFTANYADLSDATEEASDILESTLENPKAKGSNADVVTPGNTSLVDVMELLKRKYCSPRKISFQNQQKDAQHSEKVNYQSSSNSKKNKELHPAIVKFGKLTGDPNSNPNKDHSRITRSRKKVTQEFDSKTAAAEVDDENIAIHSSYQENIPKEEVTKRLESESTELGDAGSSVQSGSELNTARKVKLDGLTNEQCNKNPTKEKMNNGDIIHRSRKRLMKGTVQNTVAEIDDVNTVINISHHEKSFHENSNKKKRLESESTELWEARSPVESVTELELSTDIVPQQSGSEKVSNWLFYSQNRLWKITNSEEELPLVNVKRLLVPDDVSKGSESLVDLSRQLFDRGWRVQCWLVEVMPDPASDPFNLISGYCFSGCQQLFLFSVLHWRKDEFIGNPFCPNCKKIKQLKELELMFLFELHVMDLNGNHHTVIVSREHAELFLRCTARDFVKDERIRQMRTGLLMDFTIASSRQHSFTPMLDITIASFNNTCFLTNSSLKLTF